MEKTDILRETVVEKLKLSEGENDSFYSVTRDWIRVDEGSLRFYRRGRQPRFRFKSDGIIIDAPLYRLIGEDTLAEVTYADVVVRGKERVELPRIHSGGFREERMTRERQLTLFREFRAKELDEENPRQGKRIKDDGK